MTGGCRASVDVGRFKAAALSGGSQQLSIPSPWVILKNRYRLSLLLGSYYYNKLQELTYLGLRGASRFEYSPLEPQISLPE